MAPWELGDTKPQTLGGLHCVRTICKQECKTTTQPLSLLTLPLLPENQNVSWLTATNRWTLTSSKQSLLLSPGSWWEGRKLLSVSFCRATESRTLGIRHQNPSTPDLIWILYYKYHLASYPMKPSCGILNSNQIRQRMPSILQIHTAYFTTCSKGDFQVHQRLQGPQQ